MGPSLGAVEGVASGAAGDRNGALPGFSLQVTERLVSYPSLSNFNEML